MGFNKIVTAIAIVEKFTLVKSGHFKFIKNEQIEERSLINSTNNNVDAFDYQESNFGGNGFKSAEFNEIQCF